MNDYISLQAQWIEENKIHQGSLVRVLRKAESRENGWGDVWVPEMDSAVGHVAKVVYLNKYSICLQGKGRFNFPYFILEPISKEIKLSIPLEDE